MITDNDIKKLKTVFATKDELWQVKVELKDEILDLRGDMSKLRNDVLDMLDAVYKELKDFRQEQTFHIQKHREIDERLDFLENV